MSEVISTLLIQNTTCGRFKMWTYLGATLGVVIFIILGKLAQTNRDAAAAILVALVAAGMTYNVLTR